MHNINFYALIDYLVCGLIGFGWRYLQDRKKSPKPDWLFQFLTSAGASYLAYFSYVFYKIHITPIEVWIMLLSYMGAFIVTTIDYVAKNGILIYLRKVAEDFLAFTKKEKP